MTEQGKEIKKLQGSTAITLTHRYNTPEHYLLRCSNFIDERVILFQTTRDFHPLNVNILLFGGDGLSNEDNIRTFFAVQLFIKDSKRFAN